MKIPKLPFKLPDLRGSLSGMFDFSRKEIAIALIVTSAAVAAALVITVIVISSTGRSGSASGTTSNAVTEAGSTFSASKKPFLSDFLLYEDELEENFTGVIYSRERLSKWSKEQVEKYWIDPRIIVVDQLELETKKLILDIFADVP
jgi:hypothetical protein